MAEAEAAAKDAAAAAKAAPPEEADVANAAAATAKEAAKAALDAVPERLRAKGVWTCGAAIGDDAYVKAKLKEKADKLDAKFARVTGRLEKGHQFPENQFQLFHMLRSCLRPTGDYCARLLFPDDAELLMKRIDELVVRTKQACFGQDVPENPRLIQFQINHNFSVFRVHARPFARVQFSSRPCASLHPCAHFRVPHAVVRRSDLRVSCVAVRARTRGAVCRLTAVPASEAAHARPAELLVCVAVLLALLVPA